MIRIINLHACTEDEKEQAIYIGRRNNSHAMPQSPLANPYKISPDMSRAQAIRLYRIWLWERIKARGEAYKELERIAGLAKAGEEVLLMCYCAPKECHGDVVKVAVEWMLRKGKA